MKKRSGRITAVVCLAAVLLFSGCGKAASPAVTDASLYEQGTELVALLSEMAQSAVYLDAFTGSPEVKAAITGAGAADPANPKAVFELKFQASDLLQLQNIDELSNVSEALQNHLTAKSYSALAAQLNALGGTNLLAASSICTASQTFYNSAFTGNTIYLYVYADSAPVMVAFSANDEGIVSASGSFILGDVFQPESKADIEAFFDPLSIEITEISK